MNLSMWILADCLGAYAPQMYINSGKPVLKGARLFPEDRKLAKEYVYVGMAREFVDSIGEKVICANGVDYIIVNCQDPDCIFNEILDIFEDFRDWQDRLRELVEKGCTIQEILDHSAGWIGDFTIAGDLSFSVIAACNTAYVRDNTRYEEYYRALVDLKEVSLENALHATDDRQAYSRTRKSYIQDNPHFRNRAIIRNLFEADKQIGWLVSLELNRPITAGRMQLINMIGDLLERHQSLPQRIPEILSIQDLFQSALEQGGELAPNIVSKLERIRWKPDDPKVLLRITCPQQENAQLLMRVLNSRIGDMILFPVNGSPVGIVNLKSIAEKEVVRELCDMLPAFQARGGLSYPFSDIHTIHAAHSQARIALEKGQPEMGCIASCKENAVPYFMEILRQGADDVMCHPAVKLLREYDEANRTQLCRTLLVYLENERSLLRTAQQMGLHKNTIAYRIGRICELADLNLDDPQCRFHLLVSYHLGKTGEKQSPQQ